MSVESTLRRTQSLIKRGELTKAREHLEQLLEIYPENQIAKKQYATLVQSSGGETAIRTPAELITIIADKLKRGENLAALEFANRYSETLRKHADAHNFLGIAHSRLGNLRKATKQYERALALAPTRLDYRFNLAVNLSKQERFESAIEQFQEVIGHAPENEDAKLSLIQLFIDTTRINEAEEMLATFKHSDKSAPIVSFLWGKLKQSLNDLDAAAFYYKRAIELKSDFILALQAIGALHVIKNRTSEAINAFEQVLRHDESNTEAMSALAKTYEMLGDYLGGIKWYRKSLAIKTTAEAYTGLAVCYRLLGEDKKWESLFQEALKIDSEYPPALLEYGESLERTGKLGEAARVYSKCTQKANKYRQETKEAVSRRADIYSKLGRKESLLNCLKHASSSGICTARIGHAVDRFNLNQQQFLPNPFCANDLELVSHVCLPVDVNFRNLVAPVYSYLDSDYRTRPQSLLLGGEQSSGNLFRSQIEGLTGLEKFLRDRLEGYRIGILRPEDGIFTHWPDNYLLNCWLINMRSGGSLKPHIHETGWVSGSLYLEIPDDVPLGDANIVFSATDFSDQLKRTKTLSIQVSSGSLCLFPSKLYHHTTAFTSTKRRLLLAFDMEPQP